MNGVLRYGHFSDFLEYFWDRMSNLCLIDFKILVCISKLMSMLGKINLKSISNNLAKMAINWQIIGQMHAH